MNAATATATEAIYEDLPKAPQAANLAVVEHQAPMVRRTDGPLDFSDEQRRLIRDSYANGATEDEFAVLIEIAKVRRLDPFKRQIFFVKRKDKSKGNREVWSAQVSIDGLRSIAERTGLYDGQDEPEYIYSKQPDKRTGKRRVVACRVRVYKKGISRPFVGFAVFDEYAQKYPSGDLTSFWRDKPHVMIAKCAEALALRKGFPEETGNLYIPEEMGTDSEDRERSDRPQDRDRAGRSQDRDRREPEERAPADKPKDERAMVAEAKVWIDDIRSKEDEHKTNARILRAGFGERALEELRDYLRAHRERANYAAKKPAKDADHEKGGDR